MVVDAGVEARRDNGPKSGTTEAPSAVDDYYSYKDHALLCSADASPPDAAQP